MGLEDVLPSLESRVLLVQGDHECFPLIWLARALSDSIEVAYLNEHQALSEAGTASARVCWIWLQRSGHSPAVDEAALASLFPSLQDWAAFPLVRFRFLWPFLGNDPRFEAKQSPFPTRHIWGDEIAARIAKQGLSDDDAVTAYHQACANSAFDANIQLHADLAVARDMEAHTGLGVYELLEANWRRVSPAYSPWQVSAAVIKHVFRELTKRTIPRPDLGRVVQLLDGFVGPDHEQLPIHPLVVEQLGLEYGHASQRYAMAGARVTFRQYLIDYMRPAPRCL